MKYTKNTTMLPIPCRCKIHEKDSVFWRDIYCGDKWLKKDPWFPRRKFNYHFCVSCRERLVKSVLNSKLTQKTESSEEKK